MRIALRVATASAVLLWGLGDPVFQSTAFAQTPVLGASTPGVREPAAVPQAPGRSEVPKVATAVIRGRVLAADTGSPLRRVQVRLTAEGALGAGILVGTDDLGRYEASELAPGRYTITAEKAGYMKSAYGQRGSQDGGRPVDVADGQVLERIDLALPRGGAIVVNVTDDLGEPFAGAGVNLEQYPFVNGERRLTAVATADTDETGFVRLSELPPGDYYVIASPTPRQLVALGASDSTTILPSTYYPGVTSIADAGKVSVAPGQETIVNLRLAAVRTVTVSGTAHTHTGEVMTGILGLRRRPTGSLQPTELATVESDGSFAFSKVVPGSYTILVQGMQPREYVRLDLEVSGDVTGVVVTSTTGGAVRGRIVFDTGTPPANLPLDRFAVRAAPSWGTVMRPGQFRANDDRTFELVNVVGRSVLRPVPPGLPEGWFLKSVTLDGKDVTDAMLDFSTGEITNLEVTFTQKQTELTGSVLDARDTTTTDFVAVIFPEDHQLWTPQTRSIAAGRPDQQGRFKVTGLPPGRYLAAAVRTLQTSEEHDVELLQRLEATAARFTLEENEKKSLSLQLSP